MKNNLIVASLAATLSLPVNAQDESRDTTESVISTVQENIAYTLREPCSAMEGIKLLNCRLKESDTSGPMTGDALIRHKVAQSRSHFNFFIANGLGLPVSVVDEPTGFNRTTQGSSITERQALRANFLPGGVQASFGVQRISVKVVIPF